MTNFLAWTVFQHIAKQGFTNAFVAKRYFYLLIYSQLVEIYLTKSEIQISRGIFKNLTRQKLFLFKF